jgi:hypothetical protein
MALCGIAATVAVGNSKPQKQPLPKALQLNQCCHEKLGDSL